MAKRHLKVSGDLGRVIFMVLGNLEYNAWGSADEILRNTTSEILHRWRRALDTLMWFTISLAETTPPSKLEKSNKKEEYDTDAITGTSIWKMFMLRVLNVLRKQLPSTM